MRKLRIGPPEAHTHGNATRRETLAVNRADRGILINPSASIGTDKLRRGVTPDQADFARRHSAGLSTARPEDVNAVVILPPVVTVVPPLSPARRSPSDCPVPRAKR
jgi:hypothetical protein